MTRPPAEITEALRRLDEEWADFDDRTTTAGDDVRPEQSFKVPPPVKRFIEAVRALAAAPAPASPDEPSTQAGRALDTAGGWYDAIGTYVHCTDLTAAIVAIEREARAASASVPPLDVERALRRLVDAIGNAEHPVLEEWPDTRGVVRTAGLTIGDLEPELTDAREVLRR